jgi:outer membrane protein assembly factor BamB
MARRCQSRRTRVFVVAEPFLTIAYDAATGAQLWKRVFSAAFVNDLAVSPSGDRIITVGTSDTGLEVVTVAYDATVGTKLWVRRRAVPYGVRSPEVVFGAAGKALFVSARGTSDGAYVVAYGPGGRQKWAKTFSEATFLNEGDASAFSLASNVQGTVHVAVGPEAGTLFVAYHMQEPTGRDNHYDLVMLALAAGTGAQRWRRVYDGPRDGSSEVAFCLAVSPDGQHVYAGGSVYDLDGLFSGPYNIDFLTVARGTATGALQVGRPLQRGPV